jgi:radical SAM superfamily enzyme YgiQ (UPF0313 family)
MEKENRKNQGYGQKTWKPVSFEDLSRNRKTNRIIGMTFPRSDFNLGLEPSILTVLPDGDNVSYDLYNRDYNDKDVTFYLCSVYISGYDEFVKWALKHEKKKIVVGGYHPTTFPEDFTRYAEKVVQGPCDEIFDTIEQEGQIVTGVTKHQRLPRRDLYDVTCNQQIIPDKLQGDIVISINTSMGCNTKPPCDFCCTPMMCPKILAKPLDLVSKEVEDLKKYNAKFLFIRDENFTMQKDWRKRLEVIHGGLPTIKIYLFASANTLNEKSIKFMSEKGVYMICLGLEDPTSTYQKNKHLDESIRLMKKYGIMTYLSFIVNPLKIIGKEAGDAFYQTLTKRLEELGPEMICGNFLMPFRGTKIWDEYYAYVSPEDYKDYDSKTPFLIRNPVVREKMKFFMFFYQWKYFNSKFYNEQVRKFAVNDTLHLRFAELNEKFTPIYERIWDVRA